MLGELRAIGDGRRIVLARKRLLVGRHRLCDVVVRAATVEPVHCYLFLRYSAWHVHSFHFSDTRVNGRRIVASRLLPGDVLWIGRGHKFQILYDAGTLISDPDPRRLESRTVGGAPQNSRSFPAAHLHLGSGTSNHFPLASEFVS